MERMFDFKFYSIKSNLKWAWQRLSRGWDNRAIWSIDVYLAELIPQLVRRLKEVTHGVPGSMFEPEDWDAKANIWKDGKVEAATAKWNAILDEIAEGFEEYYTLSVEGDGTIDAWESEKFKRAFDLLRQYFSNLWD